DVLQHVTDPLQIALIRGNQLRFLHTLGRYDEATDLGVSVLRDLGVNLPRHPNLAQVSLALGRLMVSQGRRKPSEFTDLPEATDRKVQAAGRLLLQLSYPAYFAETNLLPLIGISSTLQSLNRGVTATSSYGFSVLALVLCGVTGQIDRGYAYGQLALTYARRFGGVEESLTTFVVDAFIRHYKDPLLEVAERLYEGWMRNRDGGDQENATYCAGVAQYTDFFAGKTVDFDQRHPEVVDYLIAVNMPHVTDCFLAWSTLLQALRQPDLPQDLTGPLFDYPRQIEQFVADQNGVQIAISSIAAGLLDLFAGRHDRAETRFALATRHEDRILAQVLVPGLAFFRALNAFRLAETRPAQARALRRLANRLTRRVAGWARHNTDEMAHRLALLRAEQRLAHGDAGAALLELHRTAELAGESAPLYRYLADLRRASILSSIGHVGEAHAAAISAMRHAEALGAVALSSQAEDLSAQWAPRSGRNLVAVTPDFAALHGFARFLDTLDTAGERQALPVRVLDWLLGEANADKGMIVLAEGDGKMQVAARNGSGPGATALVDMEPATRHLIDLCLRTDQAQIVQTAPGDLPAETTFGAPRVRLCIPIRVHERVVGVVYLENQVNRRAFGAWTVELVQAIANQMGLALDNDRLLRKEQLALDHQRRQTEANQRFVPEELMRALGITSITEVGLNMSAESVMTVVFADLRGFTTTAQS
ncbi:MAG: GAF domain-containing protein, partial [Paracoccaceae bacterium]